MARASRKAGYHVNALKDSGRIDSGTWHMFSNLRTLRNQALHSVEDDLGEAGSIAFADLSARLIRKIKETAPS